MNMVQKIVIGVALVAITACSKSIPLTSSPQSGPVAYPLPVNDGPLASSTAAVVYEVPTPDENTGVIIGKIYDESTKKPLNGYTIYLATIIWMTPEPSYTYGIQENSSPHTITDDQGRFAIGNVEPGHYIVMVWTPFQSSVVIDPDTNKELDVIAEAGQITDLGYIEGIDPFGVPSH